MNGMRVTGSMAARRYTHHVQTNFLRKNQAEGRVLTGRKFTRASQSPTEAVRALRVRKAMSEIETYQKNLTTAEGIYEAAEGAVRGVSVLLQDLQEELIKGAHGTYSMSDKQIIGQRVELIANQMMQLMNLIVADRRVFGGVGNSEQPFQIQGNTVLYNGVPVNDFTDHTMFPNSSVSYLDAGLGLRFLDDYTIDPQTAIPITFNGAEALGSGTADRPPRSFTGTTLTFTPSAALPTGTNNFNITVNGAAHAVTITTNNAATPPTHSITSPTGLPVTLVRNDDDGTVSIVPNSSSVTLSSTEGGLTSATETVEFPGGNFPINVIQLTLDAAAAVKSGDERLTALYADLIFESMSFISLSIAGIGSQTAFIEFNQERLTNNMFTLKDQENELEFVCLGQASTEWKMLEMIYNATLQMSVSVIPMSIFNFMK